MSFFNIHIASQLSGVAAATIRAWEKRYNVLTPARAENGHRLYSESDIEKLSILQQLTQQGLSIGKIAALSIEELKVMLKENALTSIELFSTNDKDTIDMEELRSGIMMALSAYKLDIITHELEKVKKTLSPRDFALEVIVPLFREIGYRSMNQTLSIAQEHTLSAIVQFHMGQMIAKHYVRQHLRPGLLLLAAPEGELHEIGLLAGCLLCIEYNVQFLFLGKDLPADALAEAINQMRPTSVLLGVTKGHEITEHLTLQEYLRKLKGLIPPDVNVRVGGNVKPWVKVEMETLGVGYLPTLEALDQYLSEFR
jgi:DNA-binding transcriptional MerR regulator